MERPRQSVHNQTYMRDIFLTGTANITKMYIYIQLIKVGNKSIMNKEHDASHFPLKKGGIGVNYSKSNDSHIIKASHGFYRYFNFQGGHF